MRWDAAGPAPGHRQLLQGCSCGDCHSTGLVAGLAVLANVFAILAIGLGFYVWHLRFR